jgi:hypothetical protein
MLGAASRSSVFDFNPVLELACFKKSPGRELTGDVLTEYTAVAARAE